MATPIHGCALKLVDRYLQYYDPVLGVWFPISRHYALHTADRLALVSSLTSVDAGKVECFDLDDEYNYWWNGVKWL